MQISPMLKEIETDVLVIGGGIAGAFAAYKARASGARVLLVDRSYFGRSGCSALASGVYPSYMPGDKIEDWINGLGAGPLVNQALLVKSLPVMYEHLMTMDRWGVKWLKEGKQIVRMGAPGRTFKNGVWMTEGGPQMMMAVRAGVLESGVEVLNRVAVTQLLTSDGKLPTEGQVIGAIGFHVRTGETYAIHAKAAIMCTGPYKFPYPWPGSTLGYMPVDLSGDGIAMMLQAGAELSRLELGGINLNPDNLLCAPGLESLMPSGAKFVDKNGRRFLEDYDPKRMEMTSRALLYFAVAHQKELANVPSMDLREINFERMELLKKSDPHRHFQLRGSGTGHHQRSRALQLSGGRDRRHLRRRRARNRKGRNNHSRPVRRRNLHGPRLSTWRASSLLLGHRPLGRGDGRRLRETNRAEAIGGETGRTSRLRH